MLDWDSYILELSLVPPCSTLGMYDLYGNAIGSSIGRGLAIIYGLFV